MKRKLLLAALFGIIYRADAQAPPTTGPGAASSNDWSRSGNLQTTGGNIFGTRWNSPIYTSTARAKCAEAKREASASIGSPFGDPQKKRKKRLTT